MQGVVLKEALTMVMEESEAELDNYKEFDETVPDLKEIIGKPEG